MYTEQLLEVLCSLTLSFMGFCSDPKIKLSIFLCYYA